MHERIREHWGVWKNNKDDIHMLRHHLNKQGEAEKPEIYVRAAQYHKSALTRQIVEAVCIRRRGGAGCILNRKSEFDRCKIPHKVV